MSSMKKSSKIFDIDIEKDISNAKVIEESGFTFKSLLYDIPLFGKSCPLDVFQQIITEIFRFFSDFEKTENIIKSQKDFEKFVIMPDISPYLFFRIGNWRIIYTTDTYLTPILVCEIRWKVKKENKEF